MTRDELIILNHAYRCRLRRRYAGSMLVLAVWLVATLTFFHSNPEAFGCAPGKAPEIGAFFLSFLGPLVVLMLCYGASLLFSGRELLQKLGCPHCRCLLAGPAGDIAVAGGNCPACGEHLFGAAKGEK